MNQKFFDLKKEKQDRMINAGLKVFARNGYRHASTDDIVREAGISKGLLFHYFISKTGLYEFLCGYSIKYLAMELGIYVQAKERDYFLLLKQIERAQYYVMKQFPYMVLFLKKVLSESAPDAESEPMFLEKKQEIRNLYEEIYNRVDFTKYGAGFDQARFSQIVNHVCDGALQNALHQESIYPEKIFEEVSGCLELLHSILFSAIENTKRGEYNNA